MISKVPSWGHFQNVNPHSPLRPLTNVFYFFGELGENFAYYLGGATTSQKILTPIC